MTAQPPHQIWGSDITYIRVRYGWMDLGVVLAWFSRSGVSWALDDTLERPFVLAAARPARAVATPQIWNPDQGRQFTSPPYTARLDAAGLRISMDGNGRALENSFTERCWRPRTAEEVELHDDGSPREAGQGIGSYIQVDNTARPHQALADRRPVELYGAQPPLVR